MSDATLQILIKARNEAKAEFDKLNKQVDTLQGKTGGGGIKKLNSAFKEFTGTSIGAATALAAAGMATKKIIEYTRQAIDETVAYNAAVIDQARLVGLNVEEMSRLVQAADDVFITQEQLKTALTAATRQGIDVSTEGLKKLSEEYLKLDPVAERGEFLLKKFGRSGADMGKLMELGAGGIDKATRSINQSLIVTKESAAKTILYKQALDRLNDSFTGVKYTVGNELLPVLTDFANVVGFLVEQMTPADTKTKAWQKALLDLVYPLKAVVDYNIWILDLADKWVRKTEEDTIPTLVRHKGLVEDDAESLVTMRNAQKELNDELSIADDFYKELTTQMIYNIAAAGLDKEAALQLGIEMGVLNVATISAYNSLRTANEYMAGNQQKIYDYATAYNALWQALQNVQSASDIQSQLTGIGLGGSTTSGGGSGTTLGNGTQVGGTMPAGWSYAGTVSATDHTPVYKPPGKASGGRVSGGHAYRTLEDGSEMFIPDSSGMIIPNNRTGGGAINVYVNYSPAVSLTDRIEVMTKLKPLIQEALRG